jgi:demethylmenaquinone methyltransferase / 2-methoxy-6-polyprenyl-1,4-benzoquinol methylase
MTVTASPPPLPESSLPESNLPTLAAKHSFVQALFNRIAPRYDLLNDCISLGLHRQWKRKACQRLRLTEGQQALDVCTGTGHLIHYLLPMVGPTGGVTGLDFSEAMLAVAHRHLDDRPQVRLIQGDAMALPFEDQVFQGAIVGFGLRNVVNVDRAIAQMVRVVKPGGWVVNLDTTPVPALPGFWWYFERVMPLVGKVLGGDKSAYQYLHDSTRNFATPAQLATMFESHGLVNVSVEPLAFGAAAIVSGQRPSVTEPIH